MIIKERLKNLIILFFLLSFLHSYSQGNEFDKGFESGYKNGYCMNDPYCNTPNAPWPPAPNQFEHAESYQDGYNRGFQMGYEAKQSKRSNSNNKTSSDAIVPPAKYVQPISNDILIAGAMSNQSRMESEVKEFTLTMNEIHQLLITLYKCNPSQVYKIDDNLSNYSSITINQLDNNYHSILEYLVYIKGYTLDQLNKL